MKEEKLEKMLIKIQKLMSFEAQLKPTKQYIQYYQPDAQYIRRTKMRH